MFSFFNQTKQLLSQHRTICSITTKRVWRGHVGREKYKNYRLHFRFLAMTAAALEIQRMV
jgi:hypothetical protein